ncbi:MAG: transcriptional regulator, winged helix family, partial [Ilumatobacteraceae bacterium]|nr:transcriptional regulator, winged helix family [Ilumatobacteraceae bacterium]
MPSGTVTFLFTDIEGSSVLWDRSPALMSVVLARHDEILKHAIADAGGHVFASGGDGFAAAFRSVGEALSAATSAQVQIASQEWPQAAVIRVRVGIHTGVADEREGNYFGATVSRAARICAAAAGGQVALSSLSAQLAAGDRWELVEAGTFRLTGFERPEALSRLIVPGVLDVDRPFRGALDRTVGNLRRPRGELVGREVEVDELARQLGAPGLTTLVGPGGVGKTRLALAAALVASEGFADGAWLVELAALSSPNDLVQATASALGIQLTGHQLSAVSIASALATQQRLIVLD